MRTPYDTYEVVYEDDSRDYVVLCAGRAGGA